MGHNLATFTYLFLSFPIPLSLSQTQSHLFILFSRANSPRLFLSPTHPDSLSLSLEGAWEPQDPALSYLRQAITEYCVLPIGSDDIRAAMDPEKAIKSIMFYGPSGTGKTLAVEAVSHELGALMIHLTPG